MDLRGPTAAGRAGHLSGCPTGLRVQAGSKSLSIVLRVNELHKPAKTFLAKRIVQQACREVKGEGEVIDPRARAHEIEVADHDNVRRAK